MEQLCEVRTSLLLNMSADINRRMAELRALREAVRMAEATLHDAEPNSLCSRCAVPNQRAASLINRMR